MFFLLEIHNDILCKKKKKKVFLINLFLNLHTPSDLKEQSTRQNILFRAYFILLPIISIINKTFGSYHKQSYQW